MSKRRGYSNSPSWEFVLEHMAAAWRPCCANLGVGLWTLLFELPEGSAGPPTSRSTWIIPRTSLEDLTFGPVEDFSPLVVEIETSLTIPGAGQTFSVGVPLAVPEIRRGWPFATKGVATSCA
jgi:hypothetical protein